MNVIGGDGGKAEKREHEMETSSSKKINADIRLVSVERVVLNGNYRGDKLWILGPDPVRGRTHV